MKTKLTLAEYGHARACLVFGEALPHAPQTQSKIVVGQSNDHDRELAMFRAAAAAAIVFCLHVVDTATAGESTKLPLNSINDGTKAASDFPQNQVPAARCMFIYGAIAETGDALGRSDISQFARKRFSRILEFTSSCNGNPSCESLVNSRIEEFRNYAVALKNRLSTSMRMGDRGVFDSALKEARACDDYLSISADDVPSFTPAQSVNFCLNDDEFNAIYTGAFLRTADVQAGRCIARFPDLKDVGLKNLKMFQNEYSQELISNENQIKFVLDHHRDSSKQIASIIDTAQAYALKITDGYDHHQCESVLNFLEGATIAKNFSTVTRPFLSLNMKDRKAIPYCTTPSKGPQPG